MPFYAITIILVTITGLVMGFIEIDLLIGYLPGIILGITMVVAIVRKLGKQSRKSLIASTVFLKLTNYRARVYNIQRESSKTVSAVVYGEANDYADIVDVLQKQMSFPSSVAKDAAQYAMEIVKDKPLEEKIREALIYIDSGEKKVVIRD